MCKLFTIVEIEDQKNAEIFAKTAVPFVTKTDDHGLGIMRLGERGIHIQRWLDIPTVFRQKSSKALAKYKEALIHNDNFEGQRSKSLYAIAIHGRFATCERNLQNTHPFYRNGTALMHNGVISNANEYDCPLSTCDSEAILTAYLDNQVRRYPKNLSKALKGMQGYYASIVFNASGIIDVFRDDVADLYMAHVRGVGIVIATTEEIIVNTAKACKAYITEMREIMPNTFLRWNQNELVSIAEFEDVKPARVIMPHQSLTQGTHPSDYADLDVDEDKFKSHQDRKIGYTRWWEEEDARQQEELRRLQTGYKGNRLDKDDVEFHHDFDRGVDVDLPPDTTNEID